MDTDNSAIGLGMCVGGGGQGGKRGTSIILSAMKIKKPHSSYIHICKCIPTIIVVVLFLEKIEPNFYLKVN